MFHFPMFCISPMASHLLKAPHNKRKMCFHFKPQFYIFHAKHQPALSPLSLFLFVLLDHRITGESVHLEPQQLVNQVLHLSAASVPVLKNRACLLLPLIRELLALFVICDSESKVSLVLDYWSNKQSKVKIVSLYLSNFGCSFVSFLIHVWMM